MRSSTIRQLMPVFAAFSIVTCLGAVVDTQNTTDAPYPPPGRLVDIGGWRLHLNCTGRATASQPTVILEAGIGDFSVEWSLVQPGVASLARVCSYDRAGDGWSDVGPHPRTMRQIVYELHTLLDRADERPPFVLVGHSYGGWLVRVYQLTYPSQVAGMVLVEAGSDDPVRILGDGRLVHASDLTTGQAVPAVKTANPLRESDIPPTALSQMKAGAADAAAHANSGSRAKLPADAQRMRTWALARWQHVAAAVNPLESEELAALRADRAKNDHPLDNLPLLILTRGIADETGPNAKTLEDDHQKEQAALVLLSRNGKQVVAPHSGHHIQLDQPDLVINSITGVLTVLRK